MTQLVLNIVGDLPEGLDLDPVKRVVELLNSQQPEWLRLGIINLKLVDDSAIQKLNKGYSGNDYPTDVLSFSYIENESSAKPPALENEPVELGDMVISLETAKRQAAEAGSALGDELATLVLHGVLHIHGFDHGETDERLVMDKLQAGILSQAKVNYRNFNWL